MGVTNKIFNFRANSRFDGYRHLIPKIEIDPVCGCVSREKAAIAICLIELTICSLISLVLASLLGMVLVTRLTTQNNLYDEEIIEMSIIGLLTVAVYIWFALCHYKLFRWIREKDSKKICLWLKIVVGNTLLLKLFSYSLSTEILILAFLALELYSLWIIYRYKTELERVKCQIDNNNIETETIEKTSAQV